MHIKLPIEPRGTRPTRPTTCTTSESNNNNNYSSSQVSVKMLGSSKSCKVNNKEREGRVGGGNEREREREGPRWGDTNENTCHVLGLLFCLPKSFPQLEMAETLPVPIDIHAGNGFRAWPERLKCTKRQAQFIIVIDTEMRVYSITCWGNWHKQYNYYK